MKKALRIILPVLIMAALMAGAWFGYGALKDKLLPQNGLAADPGPGPESAQEKPDDAGGRAAEEPAPENVEQQTQAAPDFTVYDAGGNAAKLSDYAGKPVVINFWASWCPYCLQEMPDFQEVYDDYKDNVMFMMINVTDGSRETVEKGETHIEEQGFTFPVFYDTELDAAGAYGASSLPATFVVDRDGNLAGYAVGMIGGQTLRTALEQQMGQE